MLRVNSVGLGTLAGMIAGFTAMPANAQVALPSRQEITPPTPQPRSESTARVDARGALAETNCPFEASALRLTLDRVEFTRPY